MASYQIERRKRGPIGLIFLVLFWAFNALMALWVVSATATISTNYESIDSEAGRAGAAIGSALGMSMLMGIWLTGAVVLGLFVLFTRGPKIIETIESSAGAAAVAGTGAPRARRMPWWGWGLGVVALLLLVGILTPSSPPPTSTSGSPAQELAEGAAIEGTPYIATPQRSNWTYDAETDEMRDATDRFATSISTNRVNMGFPYNDVAMSIVLRNSARHGRDILLTLNEGQFQCRYDGCSIIAKFDDGELQTFSVNEAASGTNGVLFIRNQTRFLALLRGASRVTIEAQFFSHGAEQFTFDVSGLEWE